MGSDRHEYLYVSINDVEIGMYIADLSKQQSPVDFKPGVISRARS